MSVPLLTRHPLIGTVSTGLTARCNSGLSLGGIGIRDFHGCPNLCPALTNGVIRGTPFSDIRSILSVPNLSSQRVRVLHTGLSGFAIATPSPTLIRNTSHFGGNICGWTAVPGVVSLTLIGSTSMNQLTETFSRLEDGP